MHPLVDTWQISHRINEYLLSAIKDEHLADVALSKGRSVGQQFAHVNNVRLMWIKAAAPELLTGLIRVEADADITRKLLLDAFSLSTPAMASMIDQGLQAGRIRGFKPHPEAFVGYLVAHEAHHRGQIILSLKENKHLPDKKILFGMWEWGSR